MHDTIRVLVADDDLSARLLMQAALVKSGCTVVLAEDGEQALSKFATTPCDVVMLDVEMPGLDGYETCRRLRQSIGAELPIVMVTGMEDLASVERAFDVGATDFIAKPINWGLLGHRVRYLNRGYENLQKLHQAQSVARLGSWHLEMQTGVLDWSPETYRMFGIPEGTPLTYQRFLECVHPDDAAALDAAWQQAQRGAPYRFEHRIVVGDEIRWVLEQAKLNFDGEYNLLSGVGTVQDITERKLQELEVLATRNRLQAILDTIPDLMFELDLEGRYFDFHSPRNELLAAPPDQLLGRTVTEVLPAEAAAICLEALREAEANGSSLGRQFALPLPQGVRWFELSVARKAPQPGGVSHFIVLSRDITERKDAEARIYRLAYFDPLTGLPNRLSFAERLDREVQRATHQQGKLAVLFLDLDRFKTVNDTLGHGAGDLLLQAVADRLRKAVRPTDLVARVDLGEVEVELARLGGDEFTLLLPQLHRSGNTLMVAQRIHELMHRPFILEGREVIVTASIGIAIFPDDGADAASLLKHADTAMYHAKEQGRDNCKFYSTSLTEEAMRRLDMESNLRLALERNEFFLLYQPQLDIASGRIRSLEALIRWQHPKHGLIAPMEFIPLAEESGLIIPIGEWVLRAACVEAMRWQVAGQPLRVAVNLSAVQFRNAGLVEVVATILRETGLAAEWLELEVTEGALMEDSAATLRTLQSLRALGLQLSLDDFGTGYSSLSYLQRLPLNNLKVDKSFVAGLPHDRANLAIVRAIVALAKNLGFTVTAEGIETHEQAVMLGSLASDMLQGYYFSKPVSPAEITALLTRQWSLQDSAGATTEQGGEG